MIRNMALRVTPAVVVAAISKIMDALYHLEHLAAYSAYVKDFLKGWRNSHCLLGLSILRIMLVVQKDVHFTIRRVGKVVG